MKVVNLVINAIHQNLCQLLKSFIQHMCIKGFKVYKNLQHTI